MMDIRQCTICNKHTMSESCCSIKTKPVYPQKYSPVDKYAQYRRKAKEAERKALGVL